MPSKGELRQRVKAEQREQKALRKAEARRRADAKREANHNAFSCFSSWPPGHVWNHGRCANCGRSRNEANVERAAMWSLVVLIGLSVVAVVFSWPLGPGLVGIVLLTAFTFGSVWLNGVVNR